MLFNSFSFALFFPVVTTLYFLAPQRGRWALLLAASSVFYMAFVPAYVLILFFTIGVDYVAGRLIESARGAARRTWLLVSLVANLGVLTFFKYHGFISENVSWLGSLAGLPGTLPRLEILLPIGLSFHTFQAMAYTVEVYRGRVPAERHLGYYALYVMFYPQLVAGPIERPQHLLPQLREEHRFEYSRVTSGLKRMAIGLFKKMVIADPLGALVDGVYQDPTRHHGLSLLLATLFFAVQVYCDFSGYSDVATGSAEVMGFRLMRNFRSPLSATSLAELWQRWHISLTSWFRDYVYIPLGGSRVSRPRWAVNIMVVFALSGLWHGAAWTYVLFGIVCGAMVAFGELSRPLRRRLRLEQPLGSPPSVVVTFLLFAASLIVFRSSSLSDARHVLLNLHEGIVGDLARLLHGGSVLGLPAAPLALVLVSLLAFLRVDALDAREDVLVRIARWPVPARWTVYFLLVYACLVSASLMTSQRFIYFQF